MSQPTPTVFYLAVFREDQSGPQHKVFTSLSGLFRFNEQCEADKKRREHPIDYGPFDVYIIDTEVLQVAVYDMVPLKALAGTPQFEAAHLAGKVAAGGRRKSRE
ncbi:MAG: hypothetical protein LAN84_09785 [Acidobacteriia bacterium]|nr:hypothetical protein [Terriglobia bacterium]